MLTPAEIPFFDTVAGLPVHPLVVHFAVVILPIAALVQIALVFVPRWRPRWATVTLLGIAGGTLAAFVAKESGESLAVHLGLPRTHALWGDILLIVAIVLTAVTTIWWWLQRKTQRPARALRATPVPGPQSASLPMLLAGLLSVGLALGVTVLTVLVGHSGAQAAWGGRLDPTPVATATPAATSSTSSASTPAAPSKTTAPPASTSTTTAGSGLTMAAVAQHASASSCWSAINGTVYDLTAWISAHPGGPGVIKGLCGGDGTAAFTSQHGGQRRAETQLSAFKLGKLAA